MKGSGVAGATAMATAVAVLLSLALTEAQPGRMGGPAMGMGGSMNLEHTLTFLAFDERVALTDEQLVALRYRQVAAVAIAPDGRRALVAKFPGHKIAVLDIDNGRVSYDADLDAHIG